MTSDSGGIVEIEEGQIRLAQITQWIDHEDIKVWNVDCDSKYAEVMVSGGDGEGGLMLFKGERTLGTDDSTDKPTTVTFKDGPGTWSHLVDGGRYSFFFIAVRHPEGVTPLWVVVEKHNSLCSADGWPCPIHCDTWPTQSDRSDG